MLCDSLTRLIISLIDSGSSNEESGPGRRHRRPRPRKTEPESNGSRPNGKCLYCYPIPFIFIRISDTNILTIPFNFLVVENSSGSRLPTTASIKENTHAEGVSKATATVSTTGNSSNAAYTGHPQPREQRNRFEKVNGGRKPVKNDTKTHDEPVNGTAT